MGARKGAHGRAHDMVRGTDDMGADAHGNGADAHARLGRRAAWSAGVRTGAFERASWSGASRELACGNARGAFFGPSSHQP